MISQAIYSLLTGDTPVSNVVGTKVFPNVATQGTAFPYITYSVVSKVPTDSKDNGTGFDKYRVQVNCISSSYTDMEVLAGYVRTALDRKTGTYGSMTILQIVYDDETDVHDDFQEDSKQVYQKAVDFLIITK